MAEERTRIARELHDVVAHHLTAVIIRAQAADRVRATRPEVASESIGWIAETAKEALTAMRATVRVLRTDGDAAGLAPEPTLGDLRSIAARSANRLDSGFAFPIRYHLELRSSCCGPHRSGCAPTPCASRAPARS